MWKFADDPIEIHLSLTNDSSVMQVMWVTPLKYLTNPVVNYGSNPLSLNYNVK